jgi:hypothetical protein
VSSHARDCYAIIARRRYLMTDSRNSTPLGVLIAAPELIRHGIDVFTVNLPPDSAALHLVPNDPIGRCIAAHDALGETPVPEHHIYRRKRST